MSRNDPGTVVVMGAITVIGTIFAYVFGKEKGKKEGKEEGIKEGMNIGINIGRRDTLKQFVEKIKNNKNLLYGTYALSLYVAKVDNDFSEEEKYVIQNYTGRPDAKWILGDVQIKLKEICDNILSDSMSFNDIKKDYIDSFSKEELKDLNEFIKDVIWADDIFVQQERDFVENEWIPYFNRKAGENIDINFYTNLED